MVFCTAVLWIELQCTRWNGVAVWSTNKQCDQKSVFGSVSASSLLLLLLLQTPSITASVDSGKDSLA